MPKGEKRFIFFIIFLLLGALVSLQFRSILSTNRQKTQAALNIEKLTAQLSEEKKMVNYLKQQISEKEKINEQYIMENLDAKNNEQLKQLKAELDLVKLKTGLTDVEGPGVVVRMDDAVERANENPMDIIIHDSDLLQVLNELKAAGAQAISINGERIISTSEQICAGPTVRINKKRYPVPYEITAIGNPDLLYKGLDESTIVQDLRDFNIRIDIEKSQRLIIPKYNGKLDDLVSALEVIGE